RVGNDVDRESLGAGRALGAAAVLEAAAASGSKAAALVGCSGDNQSRRVLRLPMHADGPAGPGAVPRAAWAGPAGSRAPQEVRPPLPRLTSTRTGRACAAGFRQACRVAPAYDGTVVLTFGWRKTQGERRERP